ncbi:streptamidine-related RiPP repeat protein [Actinotalea sp. C106]|uniref:streptamidine-related RiPP repeat protein n=1 Tax=Actinotalea sp. C106 TaxID=2908644 RepID=UPI0020288F4D|nr:streptamidine-related RiPP repeat protein [Actinotalea sp. C106]
MSDFSFQPVAELPVSSALQGPTTNALVHNPFAFEPVAELPVSSALQGPTTNALVHNPFAFGA